MISVEQALDLIKSQILPNQVAESISVESGMGRTLAEDILAPIALPNFRQSAMDGYALSLHEADTYKVIGEIKAGDDLDIILAPGEAARIFTGARVPNSANSIVIQERVTRSESRIKLENQPNLNDNIREIGMQISLGSLALPKGHRINPSSIGLLKSLGISSVPVIKLPIVSILVTGNELMKSGEELKEGKIYESNGAVIEAALRQKGLAEVQIISAKDNLNDTEKVLDQAFRESDLILVSGGISVGDYDFVGKALENLGIEEIFYKVLQKPGKPLFFGKKGDKYIFALPGNPASTLTCFYIYVNLLLDLLAASASPGLMQMKIPLAEKLENPFGRALFLKAFVHSDRVGILDHQNSSTMISFAQANALAYIPTEVKSLDANALVQTILLPYGSTN